MIRVSSELISPLNLPLSITVPRKVYRPSISDPSSMKAVNSLRRGPLPRRLNIGLAPLRTQDCVLPDPLSGTLGGLEHADCSDRTGRVGAGYGFARYGSSNMPIRRVSTPTPGDRAARP